jgi:hypothetical protein
LNLLQTLSYMSSKITLWPRYFGPMLKLITTKVDVDQAVIQKDLEEREYFINGIRVTVFYSLRLMPGLHLRIEDRLGEVSFQPNFQPNLRGQNFQPNLRGQNFQPNLRVQNFQPNLRGSKFSTEPQGSK